MHPQPPFLARPDRGDWPWLIALGAIVAGLTFAVTHRMVLPGMGSDYGPHLRLAEAMAQSGTILVPHFLYHLTTIALHAALSSPGFDTAGTLVTVGYTGLLSVVVYLVLRPVCGPPDSTRGSVLAAGLAFTLLLVAPISLLTWPRHNLYFGYVGINVYHNPSISTLKPFALLLSVVAVQMCLRQERRPARLAAAGALGVLATLAKPNYVLCLLPVLALVGAYRLWRRQPFDWTLAAAVAGPAMIVLAWQFQLTYAKAESILFAPLLVMRRFTSLRSMLPKLGLSMLFPLGVYALYWVRARTDLYFNLSWLVLGVGLGFAFLLAESGGRQGHGNFLWGAQVGLFVLFVAATRFWIRHACTAAALSPGPAGWRRWGSAGLLALHFVSGVGWYYTQVASGMKGWW